MCVCTQKKQNISVLSVLEIVLNFLFQSKRGGCGCEPTYVVVCLLERERERHR